MKSKLFILDTVVILHAMMSKTSGAYAALRKADNEGIIVVSDETLLELEEKIHHPKFDKYQSLQKRIAFFNSFRLFALNIPVRANVVACRDPKDDKFLSLGVEAEAMCIITRDEDLLVLNPFQGIPIVTTADFLQTKF
jgi:uncharacterized protein